MKYTIYTSAHGVLVCSRNKEFLSITPEQYRDAWHFLCSDPGATADERSKARFVMDEAWAEYLRLRRLLVMDTAHWIHTEES